MELDHSDIIQAIANQRNAYADESAKFYALVQKLQRENDLLTNQLVEEKKKNETLDNPADLS